MPEPSKAQYEDAIKSISELHGNMAVLARLDAILKDYNSQISEAEQLIQSDGAISSSIIKISNSVLYGGGQKNGTISDALQTVGFDQALKLVSLALSKQVFMRDLEAYGVTADAYWRYSYFAAVFMESQARRIGLDPSDAYLLGLLHAIGRVVINELLHMREVEMLWDRFVPPRQWEVAMVGFTNEVAGALLLRTWEFPALLEQRIAKQSDAAVVPNDSLLLLLHFAKQLALHLDDPPGLRALCAPRSHLYLARHRQDPQALEQEALAAIRHIDEVNKSLRDALG